MWHYRCVLSHLLFLTPALVSYFNGINYIPFPHSLLISSIAFDPFSVSLRDHIWHNTPQQQPTLEFILQRPFLSMWSRIEQIILTLLFYSWETRNPYLIFRIFADAIDGVPWYTFEYIPHHVVYPLPLIDHKGVLLSWVALQLLLGYHHSKYHPMIPPLFLFVVSHSPPQAYACISLSINQATNLVIVILFISSGVS